MKCSINLYTYTGTEFPRELLWAEGKDCSEDCFRCWWEIFETKSDFDKRINYLEHGYINNAFGKFWGKVRLERFNQDGHRNIC